MATYEHGVQANGGASNGNPSAEPYQRGGGGGGRSTEDVQYTYRSAGGAHHPPQHTRFSEDDVVLIDSEEVQEEDDSDPDNTKYCMLGVKFFIGFVFFLIVLICTVFSKITLVSLTDQLRNVARNITDNDPQKKAHTTRAVTLYWQLFLVLIVPNCVTFLRCLVFGVVGKTRKSYPWPTTKAVVIGIISSVFEVIAMCVLVYLVFAELPSDVSILLLNGVFSAQLLIDIKDTHNWVCYNRGCFAEIASFLSRRRQNRRGYVTVEDGGGQESQPRSNSFKCGLSIFGAILENRITKVAALILQVGGVIALIILLIVKLHYSGKKHPIQPIVGIPLVLLVMSVIWSNRFQEMIAKPMTTYTIEDDKRTARYKSSFINSGIRIFLYPFISYIIFRYASSHRIDPWCLNPKICHITLSGDSVPETVVQIITTFFGYIIAWTACTMTLSRMSLATPLLLSTPITIFWYYIDTRTKLVHKELFPTFEPDVNTYHILYPVAPIVASLLWFGQFLAIGYFIYAKENIILSSDQEMFLTPHYDGVFLEQHMILNRQTKKEKIHDSLQYNRDRREPPRGRTIFICSTMYRENATEMKQMLKSIHRVAVYAEQQGPGGDKFESHIFFDGAIIGTQLQQYGLQLISLLEETLNVKLGACKKEKTPYGYRFSWRLGKIHDDMPFTIHFKDKTKVKPKKRWSQVMYMSYVLHKIQKRRLDPKDTFILTTDADIDFSAESAVVLLDMLASNDSVAAVCARTHPKGGGPIYWYQVFDYAIGHWFQKPAEHILGCVLCSPGCFSVFRCSALKQVLEEYSSEVTSAMEFLMKDMGEDRWLCTLLIKKGWRLEYCAISQDHTYCPEDFSEFFKQRRRWIPSTIANLATLISEAGTITKHNDSISILFILFQAIMIFSTAISPATVILVITSGLQSAYNVSEGGTYAITSILLLVSIFYACVCLYASQETQIDVAKVLTFFFAILMATVVAGIVKGIVDTIYSGPTQMVLTVPNCTEFEKDINNTKGLETCLDSARIAENLNNAAFIPKHVLPKGLSTTILYTGSFVVTYLIAALLHFKEWWNVVHGVWYILALPSGYLLLLIYSTVNLDSTSWGTREGSSGADKGLLGWIQQVKSKFKKGFMFCLNRCCKVKDERKDEEMAKEEPAVEIQISPPSRSVSPECEPLDESVEPCPKELDPATRTWLRKHECERYASNFEDNGYTNQHFIAAMKPKDFEAIGIDKRGFRLRLQKAAQTLPSLPIEADLPDSVERWLIGLEMEEYTELFHREGYRTADDIENLKTLTEKELRKIGVKKRAHLQRLKNALDQLLKPSPVQQRIRCTKAIIENVPEVESTKIDSDETNFWDDLIYRKLKPVSARFTQVEDIIQSLRSMRNSILVVILLMNILWIVLLYTLSFPSLSDYGLDPRGFQLLFLAVYGIIIIVQFITMICHRAVTLVHFLGRVKRSEVIQNVRRRDVPFAMLSVNPASRSVTSTEG